MSARTDLAQRLTIDWAAVPALADVVVVATEAPLDDPHSFTALIRSRTITRAANRRSVGLLLTLITPHLNADRAQADLDARLDAVLDYLDTRHQHEPAEPTSWRGERLAYDIPLTLLT